MTRRPFWDVFISHAALQDSTAAKVLRGVKERLESKGLHVFVSHEIAEGDEWYPAVVAALADCKAVIALLDSRALKSHWVRREVNILMWRRALGTPMPVFPVLMDNLESGALKKAGIPEASVIQMMRENTDYDPDELAGRIARKLADLSGIPSGDDPMADWLRRLARYLEYAHERDRNLDGVLEAAAGALGVAENDFHGWNADRRGSCLFLASQFLVALPERVEAAAARLIRYLRLESRQDLIDDLVAVWVPAEAAAAFLPEPGGPTAMTILLNARYDDTPARYIQRATCGANHGYMHRTITDHTLPTGEGGARERVDNWEDAVWREFFPPPRGFESDRILPSRLDHPIRYLVIRSTTAPDTEFAQAVGLLHERFPFLVVVVTTGDDVATPEIQSQFADARVVLPPLTPQQEMDAQQFTQGLHQLLVPVSAR